MLVGVLLIVTSGLPPWVVMPVGAENDECDAGTTESVPGGASGPGDPHVVSLGGLVFQMVLDRNSVFALHQVTVPVEDSGPGRSYQSSSMALSRVDRRSREVTRGDSVCFGFEMAMAGRSLWVLDLDFEAQPCSGVLYRFDPGTLRRTRTVRLPPPPPVEPAAYRPSDYSAATADEPTPCDDSAMAATPDGQLWVAVGRHLHRLSGEDGDIEVTLVTAAPTSALAVDPRGRHLYTVEDSRVIRRDATRGVARASSQAFVDRPTTVAAAAGGPWVGLRHDDDRRLVRLDADRLHEETRLDQADIGYAVAVGRRTLWAMAADRLYCADPTSGRLRADSAQGPGASEIAADGAGAYLNTPPADRPDRGGIYVVEPEAACRW